MVNEIPQVTAVILARNEENRLEPALQSLQPWCSQIILLDNESTDGTASLGVRYGCTILSVTSPAANTNFDSLRNLALPHALGDWILFLDADERIPPKLGNIILDLLSTHGHEFDAVLFPFKHYFCGKWMQHSGWWPGYTRPQLLKKGRFRYNERLHGGVLVEGKTIRFPADDPDLAITHFSYDNLTHYFTKLNRYTTAEAENLRQDGQDHSWRAQIAAFVHDWQVYYERGEAHKDGMHGFVLSFLSATYRLISRAKLWDLRRKNGELISTESINQVPGSLREILEFMAEVAQTGSTPYLRQTYPIAPPERTHIPLDWLNPSSNSKSEFYNDASYTSSRSTPSQPRISACVLARNEEKRIEPALKSLRGWCDEIIVIDNESEDNTVAIAKRYADHIVTAPRSLYGGESANGASTNFDAARNLMADVATGDWIFVLDADERVPAKLAEALRKLVVERGEEFDVLHLPSRNIVCDKWLQSPVWWPGYKAPYLLRRGTFRFGERLHSGVEYQGRALRFPATDDPELAIRHESVSDIASFLEKLNAYTDADARNLLQDGRTKSQPMSPSSSWQAQLADFTQDWFIHYDKLRAYEDGMHGFVFAFLCAFYRFLTRAKLWDLRQQSGDNAINNPVPGDLREMLEFMARVTVEGPGDWLSEKKKLPRIPLIWSAGMLDPSGYANEARNFVFGLLEAGEEVAIAPMNWSPEDAQLPEELRSLLSSISVPPLTPADIFVWQTTPSLLHPAPNALVNVVRTMFETDGLQPGWERILNQMDRIWVPSEFNRDTFARSGVTPEKIVIIPGAIDPLPFADPNSLPWETVPASEPFCFLSVFDWSLHKGWDVLLTAFATAFGEGNQDVGLIIKTWSSLSYTFEDIHTQADEHLQQTLGKSLTDFPNIHIWQERIPQEEMPRLYRAVHAYVTPTRGEGWGRPLMEAMASGLPTIATAWSGLTEFHDVKVGYPLKFRLVSVPENGAKEIPIYVDQQWAEPDIKHLIQLLRQVASSSEAEIKRRERRSRAGQKRIQTRFSRAAVTKILQKELAVCRQLALERASLVSPSIAATTPRQDMGPLPRLPKANPIPVADPIEQIDFIQLLGRPLRIRWEGDQSLLSSLALVNRELCYALLQSDDIELSLVEHSTPWHRLTSKDDPRFEALFELRNRPLSGPPDIVVRHAFPPNWNKAEEGAKLLIMQPWELSHVPERAWVEGACERADAVLANSRFVRDIYVRSGVPAEKVLLAPEGARTEVFRPDGPRLSLPTRKSTRFLFVGGTLIRKGADLLLEAYLKAFTASDDVCLIVKDMGTRTFYQGQNVASAFKTAMAEGRRPGSNAPEVLYMDNDLSEAELAALYRSCTCLVAPYRGEGFCLPALEAMASGLPIIVTSGGPSDDYADDSMALRVPHHRIVHRDLFLRDHGKNALVDSPWEIQPDTDSLIAALHWVYENPEETSRKGKVARHHVVNGWTWDHAGQTLRALFATVIDAPSSPAVPMPTPWSIEKSAVDKKEDESTLGDQQHDKLSPSLSLCMIARDEESRIAECLNSIRPFVDEMIVVDTGSQDRTREIAYSCGAKVLDFPWSDSFAEARNVSLSVATGDWIFWMDADDVISPESGKRLRELINQHPIRDVAYQVQVRIPPGPGEFSASVVDHVKLFPNRPELRFEHRIHEQILPALRSVNIPVEFSDVFVTHAHYDRSPEGQAKKRHRDFTLLYKDLRDRPNHPFVLFNLGMTHLYATKEFEVAAQFLERSLILSHPKDSIVRKAFALLTTCRVCQQEWDQAISTIEQGLRHYPDDVELLFYAGQTYQHIDRPDIARRSLEKLLGIPPEADYTFMSTGQNNKSAVYFQSVDVGLQTYRGWHEMALLYRRQGDMEHCIQTLSRLLELWPTYLPARSDLADVLAIMNQYEEAGTIPGTTHIR